MTAPENPILARIRGLLAHAESTGNVQEAEAFTAKAVGLMAKYGIEHAMLSDVEPETDTIGDSERIRLHAPYALDKVTLLHHVAEALGCKMVFYKAGPTYSATVFGYESDRERVNLLFTSLLVQATHAMAATQVPFGESVKAFRRTWYQGFAIAVHERLKVAENHARQQAEAGSATATAGTRSTALVLADRADRVQDAWRERTQGIKAISRKLSGSGRMAGYRDGQRADLGNRRALDRSHH
ncbi:DUF2786 domain-containing protein [Actinomadura rayongensis]|nr:DUF2786 domain-containing protein [Actinomadura rayongensis]